MTKTAPLMPKPTIQSRLITALLARGYVEDTASRVMRYRVFRPTAAARSLLKPNPEHDLTHRVYSGETGALRYSSAGTVGNSIPFSPRTIIRLCDEGDAGGIDAYNAGGPAARVPS